MAEVAEVDTRPETLELDGRDDNQQLALATTNTEVAGPTEKKVKKIIRRKKRPARPQIDPALIKSEPPPQTGTIFNIWYNKWSGGDREDKYLSQTKAKGRCNIAEDSGYTRADNVSGSYFCLYFARGICPKGQDCEYLHRLPGIHDIFNPSVDCFGVSSSPLCWILPQVLTHMIFTARQVLRLPRRHGRCGQLHAAESYRLRRPYPRHGRHRGDRGKTLCRMGPSRAHTSSQHSGCSIHHSRWPRPQIPWHKANRGISTQTSAKLSSQRRPWRISPWIMTRS